MNTATGRKGGLGRLLGPAMVALLIWYVVTNPSEAAANTQGLLAWLESSADSLVSFFEQVTATQLGGAR